MGDFLSFRKMITPVVIQVIFWILVLVTVISGVVQLAGGYVVGLVTIILGPILIRVYCELLILAFKIYDALLRIDRNTGGAGAAEPPAVPASPVNFQ